MKARSGQLDRVLLWEPGPIARIVGDADMDAITTTDDGGAGGQMGPGRGGRRECWQYHTPELAVFGPVTLTIDDPNSVCRRDVGKHMFVLGVNLHSWELESPVARPRM